MRIEDVEGETRIYPFAELSDYIAVVPVPPNSKGFGIQLHLLGFWTWPVGDIRLFIAGLEKAIEISLEKATEAYEAVED